MSIAAIQPLPTPFLNTPALVGPAVASPVTTSPGYSTQPIAIVFGSHGSGFTVFFAGFAQSGLVIEGSSAGTAGSTSGTSTIGAGVSTATSSPITPLAATIISGPAGINHTPIIVVVAPQPLVANLGPSTIPLTAQQVLATATAEEGPMAPPVLGQGFESPVGQGFNFMPVLTPQPQTKVGPVLALPPGTDYVEPYEAVPQAPAPAAPASSPDQSSARLDIDPIADVVLEPGSLTDWGKNPASPVLVPRVEATTQDEYPTWSLASVAGTFAIASGGYQLVWGGSRKLNQKWMPARRLSKDEGRGRML